MEQDYYVKYSYFCPEEKRRRVGSITITSTVPIDLRNLLHAIRSALYGDFTKDITIDFCMAIT